MADIQTAAHRRCKPARTGTAIAALLLAGLCGCGSSQSISTEQPPTEGPVTPVMRCAPAAAGTTTVADASGCVTPSGARS